MVHSVDDYDVGQFLSVAGTFGSNRFGYVVTPNADHLIRVHDDLDFRTYYQHADYVLMDSRFCVCLVRLLRGIRLPICTGADLTQKLLTQIVSADDRIVIIGGAKRTVQQLAARLRLRNVYHFEPPMGFIHNPRATEQCLQLIENASPFRFCFLAVGSPQQEHLAHELRRRGVARGLALCVGASLNFLSGLERHAPAWMQRACLEWLYRLSRNPRRLGHRYLIRGPRIFGYLLKARFVLRDPSADANAAGHVQ
ncbi:MAG: WecB/TagA/CpsF family glycosyltransferase [Proteobacteria bacterium]|nr:WecB/TagA/CpsF family glycosyltransferase [Pseudomonadota bacterium]